MSSEKALKIARNMFKVGQVSSIYAKKGMVKVLFPDKDNIVSDYIPLLSFEYHMPDIGDQVWCIFLGNGLENGMCLGKTYSEKNLPPAQDENIYKKQIDEDMHIEYNKQSKKLNLKVESVDIEIIEGRVSIKADEILVGSGATEGIPLGDSLKAWLDSHTHGSSEAPSTSSPAPSKKVKTI